VVKAILECQGTFRDKKFRFAGKEFTYKITRKDVLRSRVSVNVPYQRFLAGLLPSFNAFGDGIP